MNRTVAALAAVFWIASGTTASPLNPAAVDILGLRLGMTEAAVAVTLQRQGVQPGAMARSATGCGAEQICRVVLHAAMRDGDLALDLAGEPPVVDRITYRFSARRPGEGDVITDAVVQRFGQPDQPRPMTWCRQPSLEQRCPAAQPSLRFIRETMTLVLTNRAADGDPP